MFFYDPFIFVKEELFPLLYFITDRENNKIRAAVPDTSMAIAINIAHCIGLLYLAFTILHFQKILVDKGWWPSPHKIICQIGMGIRFPTPTWFPQCILILLWICFPTCAVSLYTCLSHARSRTHTHTMLG